MLAIIIAALVVAVVTLMAFGIAALLHLQGAAYAIFVASVVLIGIAAAITILILHFRSKRRKQQEGGGSAGAEATELDLLLTDANRKLRSSQHGAKTLESLPLIYVLGQSGSAKTTTIMQSGLDPELVAGTAAQTFEQAPTGIINLWFTGSAAVVEIGASLRENASSLARLVHRTRAKAYRSAFGSGAAPRAAIVCVSMDQVLAADGGQSLLAAARATNAQLREISRILGNAVPVYVIVTKLDRVPHFEQYVRNLSEDEVRQIVGATMPRSDASAGTYADEASRALASVLDRIVYRLGEFRVEMLDRETDARNSGGVYEFPREFGKIRKNLNRYLVELCKPSQLNANPYLRGFYFTGIRALVVERAASAPVADHVPAMQEVGATQFLNLSKIRAEAAARTAVPSLVATRVPQWSFLPRLLPEVILADKTALVATKQSAPARLFRRLLYASLLVLFAVCLIFIVVSYLKNRALEQRVEQASATLARSTAAFPGTTELVALDDLRQTISQLDDYAAKRVPLTYRFGLYQGAAVDAKARRIYFDHFRGMLLNPTQQNWLTFLRALPDSPAANSDSGAYQAAYKPLKAYLITTSNSEKSQVTFLTQVFLQYWLGARTIDPQQQQLAQRQIDFYGNELLRQPPYTIAADSAVVGHARGYLSSFVAETRIYQSMLSDADRTSSSIDFNKLYPGSASYVTDPHVVRGAFTQAGFSFMQDAIQHPEKYAQGEVWVLGGQAAQALNASQMSQNLGAQYTSDFLKEWHQFLVSARVGGCGSIKEAPARLNFLAGPSSPLLYLFFTVSHNTAVANQTIKSTFQPTQALVDPNATDRLIGDGNRPYVTALAQVAEALNQLSQNPAPDANLFSSTVSPLLSSANLAVTTASQGFTVDKQMHTEATVADIMKAPIQCVAKLAPSPGAAANGGGQKICAAITPLLGKFPFAPSSPNQASLQDVDAAFRPETGALWTSYKTSLNQYLSPQGTLYGANPAAPQPVNPRFVQYFNRAMQVSSTIYPAGQKSPSFNFSLRFLPSNGVPNASLVVDSLRTPTSGASQQFTWNGAPTQHASLALDNREVFAYEGTWAAFQLIRSGTKITPLPGGHAYRVDYPIDIAVAGHTLGAGNGRVVSFELSGPGADLLVPEGFAGISCVAPVVR